jgi:curved DNA-binding protein CbpA
MIEKLPPSENVCTKTTLKMHVQGSNINAREHDIIGKGFNEGTTRQDNSQIECQEQLNTIDALTKHYNSQAEREEAEFKIEEERRRKIFLEQQKQRKTQYTAKLTELEKNNIDALKIFGLSSNYSLEELKRVFKKLALKYHPDKPTGNEEQFQLITKCFMLLLERHKSRNSDRQYNDLKNGSKTYLEEQKTNMNSQSVIPLVDKDKFDVKMFNKIYEQNKLWTSNDDGYGSWFSSNDIEEPANEIFGKKFNINVFNSAFEEYKTTLTSQSGAIQEYNEPRELVSCSTAFTDIHSDAQKIDDFSKPLPIGKSGREMGYTDLKTAYSSRGAFIDPNSVEYKTYKSVDELKKDRGNIKYDMTPEQIQYYQMKKLKEQKEEEKRQYLIQQRDNIIGDNYSKIHQKILGFASNGPT